VRFAHEVHPSEIAYDYWSSVRSLEAIGHREAFGFNWDPSHMMWQDIDPVGFIVDFKDRIYHVDCKDTRMRPKTGRAGVLGSHLPWGDPRRGWDFVSTDFDRVGRRRDGSAARREGGARIHPLSPVEAADGILRRGIQQPGLISRRSRS
jgi:hypothetical protein